MTGGARADGRVALYRFFDVEKSLLYVGISTDPDRRQAQHARDAADTWYHLIAERTVDWFDTRDEAEAAEKQAIADERPRFNMRDAGRITPEAWQAYTARQQKKERDRSVRIPVCRPGEAAALIREAMTDGQLVALMYSLRELGADDLKLPPVRPIERRH